MAAVDRSIKNDKNQNIQVFVRVRPLNAREHAIRSYSVVDVVNNKEVVVRQSHTKRFTFDRAFGPNAEQVEVYKEVVSPLIAEVLAGYNCTVFAYGQTGTGKTHTMVGESSGVDIHWQNDPLAGIIPRALSQLFDELRISNTEYNVRVSYLELYNEELCDLLSSSSDNSKLRIYEDVNKKGSTIVNGLEEITVYNKNDVYDIMIRGQERKKVASTLMNSQSSRSHTVFTIVVHIKEGSHKGEELVKIGKLNLVDLAGSENISKAGSDNPGKKERARECVNINQSLLTLGRVITALVEKHPHIPYRESKLTRILQESLGGRTKTSIIATVSPGRKDLEETMSTLEYANRAKNIQNKPEVNQKLTKQAVLKEYAEEVDKLKRELFAAREKNGVYLPLETYEEMNIKHDEQRREIQELLLKKRAMEEERERMETVFRELEMQHEQTQDNLMSTRSRLENTVSLLMEESSRCMEQQQLVSCLQSTERELTAQAREILAAADAAATDTHALHDNVDRRRDIENNNQQAVKAYRDASTAHRNNILGAMQHLTNDYTESRNKLQAHIDDQTRDISMTQEMNIQDLKLLVAKLASSLNDIKALSTAAQEQMSQEVEKQETSLQQCVSTRSKQIQQLLALLAERMSQCVKGVKDTDVVGMVDRSTAQWLSGATDRVSCLQRAHGSYHERNIKRHSEHTEDARRRHSEHVAALQRAEDATHHAIQQREQDLSQMRLASAQRLEVLEKEYRDADTRMKDTLKQLDDMRTKLLEDMTKLKDDMATRKNEIQSELDSYCDTTAKRIERERDDLQAIRRAKEKAKADLKTFCDQNDECVVDANDYDTQFGEGISAINAEMEAFSTCVGDIVAHNVDVLKEQLDKAEERLKDSSKEICASESESSSQFVSNAGGAMRRVADTAQHVVTGIVCKTQESTASALETISCVNERSSLLTTETSQVQSSASAALCEASNAVRTANDIVRSEVNTHADMEGRYLMKEFVVYSPTGGTPVRREYRYPRRLAATSPQDRILARLRQQRLMQQNQHPREREHNANDSPGSDCVVIEGDESMDRNISDSDDISESSASEGVSEDSGVAQQ